MLRLLVFITVVGLTPTLVVAQEVQTSPSVPTSVDVDRPKQQRIGHLLRAADHLQAVGMTSEAAELEVAAKELSTEDDTSLDLYKRLADVAVERADIESSLCAPAPANINFTCSVFRLTSQAVDRLLATVPPQQTESDPPARLDRRVLQQLTGVEDVVLRGLCCTSVVVDAAPVHAKLVALCEAKLATCGTDEAFVTTSGRGSVSHLGGEFPSLEPMPGGGVAIEYKKFGDHLHFVPFRHGDQLAMKFRIAQNTVVMGEMPEDERLAAPTFLDRRECSGTVDLGTKPVLILAHEIWVDDRTPNQTIRSQGGAREVLQVVIASARNHLEEN